MKTVVLLSGGIDSSVCLAIAMAHFDSAAEITALTLYYGQKHDKELESAKAVAAHYGVNHMIKDLSAVFELSDAPLLKNAGTDMPEGDYAEQQRESNGMVKTYVPFRNGLFLSYATAIAYSLGAGSVGYGAHADDAAGNAYPDCSPEFFVPLAQAVYEGTGRKVELIAPLLAMNKRDIVHTGVELDVPFHLTWSCYNGGDKACGKCGTCIDRKKAFEVNGLVDPIEYEE